MLMKFNIEILRALDQNIVKSAGHLVIVACDETEFARLVKVIPDSVSRHLITSEAKVETVFKSGRMALHKVLLSQDARSQAEQGAELAALVNLKISSLPVYFICEDLRKTLTLVEGFLRSFYTFKLRWEDVVDRFKDVKVYLFCKNLVQSDLPKIRQNIDTVKKLLKWTSYCRWLIDLPSNICDPVFFAEQAEKVAKSTGLNCAIWNKDKLRKSGFGGIVSVAGDQPGFLIDLRLERHRGKSSKRNGINHSRICLAGKGLTFDTGGICVKPPDGMNAMKSDMSGAAIVLCTTAFLAELGYEGSVRALAGVTCNGISAGSIRPGDVIKIKNGQLVQVDNTDAEGRLVLADLISWAVETGENNILTIATLTGGIRVGLGLYHAGVFSTDKNILDKLEALGEETGEKCWRLPFEIKYADELRVSDDVVSNIGNSKSGQPILAAMFLKKFVPEGLKFTHMDVAGVCYHPKPLVKHWGAGATGYGVKLLSEFIRR